jgi:ATP-dependent RNA helicase DDX58
LQHIPVDAIIGTQADSDNKGVSTQRWQMEVLNKFREGNKKVLFSTTVTEEGLDVVKCNLVIRYVHVTNEIAMVQSRGRARTKEARYVVIYHEKEDWIGKKEDVNQQRNDMMITAVERFQKYDKIEIFRIMKNVIEARNRERLRRRGSMTKDNSEQSQITYHLLCKRCDELATNSTFIRRRNTLHFCIDSDVRNRCVLVNAPQNNCNDIEIIGKLKCKKCQVQKWGVQCRYMGKSIVVLKIKHFNLLPVMQDNTFGPCELCDQWSKVPFAVKELDMSDLFN